MSKTVNTTKKQPYLDAWLEQNPEAKKYVGASGTVLPEGASREERDLASIYASAASNAESIDLRAQQSILDANKARDLATKYLAVQNEANGLGGLGIADTSYLRLSSQYQKALADANATREESLLQNYLNASEKANTVRGEWASQEKAEFDKIKADLINTDDENKAKEYLVANGFKEGTEEFDRLMSYHKLTYGESAKTEKETMNNYGVAVDENNAPIGLSYDVASMDSETLAYKIQADEGIKKGVYVGFTKKAGNQTRSLANVLEQSKTWGTNRNGTYVDFNDGKGSAIYVFKDGKWYKTNKTENSLKSEGITLYDVDDF